MNLDSLLNRVNRERNKVSFDLAKSFVNQHFEGTPVCVDIPKVVRSPI